MRRASSLTDRTGITRIADAGLPGFGRREESQRKGVDAPLEQIGEQSVDATLSLDA